MSIGVTHLNHTNEEIRMAQLLAFEDIFNKCDIVVGDFNSIDFDDYNDMQYKRIPESHQGGKVIKYITDQLGYIDAHKILRKEKESQFTMASNDPFMRIDYVFLSQNFYNKITGGHLHCYGSMESDHLPVVFDFTFD